MSTLRQGIAQYTLNFNTITSTHNQLFAKAENPDFPHGMYITAEEQSTGRGQRENLWHAKAGKNLLFSLLLKDPLVGPRQAWLLNAAAAMAVMDLFAYYSVNGGIIKWPNDIYLGNKKVAGILIKNGIGENKVKHSVISVGLNVNQMAFPDHLAHATSMALHQGRGYDLLELKWLFASYIAERCHQLASSPDEIRGSFTENLYGYRNFVPMMIDGQKREARVNGLLENGDFNISYQGSQNGQTFDQHRIKFLIKNA